MEKVHRMSSSSIHIHYNHDPVQAQLCTQRAWERCLSTLCTEVVGIPSKEGVPGFLHPGEALPFLDAAVLAS